MSKRRCKPVKYYSQKRRAIYEAGDDIDHLILFALHGWVCNICKGPINKRLRFPNYMAATVDHLTPLSKGGTHTWDNVAPAHGKCNFEKSDSLPNEAQVTMVA